MMTLKKQPLIFILTALLFSVAVSAQDTTNRLELEGTSIIGNKELPRILYIVPWKPAQKIDIPAPPIVSILDQPLRKLDRNEFRRQVRFHQVVFPSAGNKP